MGLGLTLTVRRKKPAVVVNSQGKGQTGPADPLAGVESVQPGRLRDKELERLDKIQAIHNSSSVADTIIHTSLDLSDASSEPSTSSRSNAHITLGSGAASPDEAVAASEAPSRGQAPPETTASIEPAVAVSKTTQAPASSPCAARGAGAAGSRAAPPKTNPPREGQRRDPAAPLLKTYATPPPKRAVPAGKSASERGRGDSLPTPSAWAGGGAAVGGASGGAVVGGASGGDTAAAGDDRYGTEQLEAEGGLLATLAKAAKAIGMEEHLDALLQHASRAKQTASGFTRLQEPGAGGAVSDKSAAAKPFQAQLSELLSHYGVPSSKQSLAKWVQGTVRKCVDRTPCGSALRSASNARPRWLSKCLPKPGAGSASKAPEPQFRDALDHVGRQQREGIEILRRARRAVAGVGAAA